MNFRFAKVAATLQKVQKYINVTNIQERTKCRLRNLKLAAYLV